jgi:hypothetical protein
MVVPLLRRVFYMNLLVLVCVNSSHFVVNGMEWNQSSCTVVVYSLPRSGLLNCILKGTVA